MSWNASFLKAVPRIEAAAAIDQLSAGQQTEGPAIAQCELAKKAAKAILDGIPGPYVQVSMSGHANGIGWKKKVGWSNDTISVTVAQFCEEDI